MVEMSPSHLVAPHFVYNKTIQRFRAIVVGATQKKIEEFARFAYIKNKTEQKKAKRTKKEKKKKTIRLIPIWISLVYKFRAFVLAHFYSELNDFIISLTEWASERTNEPTIERWRMIHLAIFNW